MSWLTKLRRRDAADEPIYQLGDEVRVFAADLTGFVVGVERFNRGTLSPGVTYTVEWWTGSEVRPRSRMREEDLVRPWRTLGGDVR